MRDVFVDASFWIALINKKDDFHDLALKISMEFPKFEILTTQEVLIEVFNYFSEKGAYYRSLAVGLFENISQQPNVTILNQSEQSFVTGIDLYSARNDKGYSLTDCISMCAMRSHGILAVLTNDQHFGQEGFEVLLNRTS